MSNETSGHVSVASGGVTPSICRNTIRLAPIPERNAQFQANSMQPSHDSPLYYLKLWRQVLKRRRMPYRIMYDAKCCFRQSHRPAILWFPANDVMQVRNWYINFRLCNDNFPVFFKHELAGTLEINNIKTPPYEFDIKPKYF